MYDDHADRTTHLATDLPCPSWCDHPTGHPLVIDDPLEPVPTRVHTARLGTGLVWELTQVERAAGPAGPIDREEPVSGLCLTLPQAGGRTTCDTDPLPVTPADLRAHAATLLRAADTLDQIHASTRQECDR